MLLFLAQVLRPFLAQDDSRERVQRVAVQHGVGASGVLPDSERNLDGGGIF